MARLFDYIVVGAGSAGAALSARLAERGAQVLLLEAGAPRERDFWVRVPIGIARIVGNPDYVWQFHTEPQTALVGQTIYWPRGKLPGGSSSVNGMVFSRGDPAEFDHWRELGNSGWGYDDVLPYFKRLESTLTGSAEFRGRNGPVAVTALSATPDPLSDAFLTACEQARIPLAEDYNSRCYEGASYLQLSTLRGRRSSTATAYLHGAGASNLLLETQAVARRVLFEGRRAIGIEYERDGQRCQARARKEVILAAGPIKSPQLLELSGVGDGDLLQMLGIPVVHHLPGVGENLIDHLQSRLTLACTKPITLNEIVGSRWRQAWMGARYLVSRRGLMATPSCTAHALTRASPLEGRANVKIQLHHLSGQDRFEVASEGAGGSPLDRHPGFSIGFFQLRPQSRGHVHIRSTDVHHAPEIQPHYLTQPADQEAMVAALRLARRVVQQPGLAPYVARETRPGARVSSDQEMLDYIRASGQTSFHPVGTCKMGTDALAVVNPSLQVYGVEGLRVVDSSIMPTMPSSNTNAASIMIGERAADLILPAWHAITAQAV